MKLTIFRKILFVVIIMFLILNAGNFLTVGEKPLKSDVIIVLGGSSIPKADYSIKLYNEGNSNMLLFSGGNTDNKYGEKEAEVMEKEAIYFNIPRENIMLEDKSISTYENAMFTKKILIEHGFKSAIIVTSNYHMRRSRLVFNKTFKNTGIKLTFCSVEDTEFNPKWWFTKYHSINIVLSEYAKIVGYFLKGRLV
ncbi:MAG: YdcF family protein [Clostridiaceae bacterium]|nr:YdcF family protein [Clostridiaceae bacterium]